MKKLMFILLMLVSFSTSSFAGTCPWCRGTGIYNAPAVYYGSVTLHRCAMCNEIYTNNVGHSCHCRKCGVSGNSNRRSSTTSNARNTDYSNDVMMRGINWDAAALGCLYTNPCRMVRGMWKDDNTALAQFQIVDPSYTYYDFYYNLITQLAETKSVELSRTYGRRIISVVELYDANGRLLKRVSR